MARKLRLEYEGAIYHVMSRGDRREPIFQDAADRVRFLETLGEACAKTVWQVQAELRRLRWSAASLAQRRKGDPDKVQVARRLRTETTMTLSWIAERLQMGTKTHVAHLLYWADRK